MNESKFEVAQTEPRTSSRLRRELETAVIADLAGQLAEDALAPVSRYGRTQAEARAGANVDRLTACEERALGLAPRDQP